MQEIVDVTNGIGLQSRAAATFVQIAGKFKSHVWIEINNKKVDGKSILGLMAMGVYDGSTIKITVSGDDEQEAFKYLVDFMRVPFDGPMYVKMLEGIPNHNDPEAMKRWEEEHSQSSQNSQNIEGKDEVEDKKTAI